MEQENPKLKVTDQVYTLEKYDGDPLPENLVETVYLDSEGKILKIVRKED